MRDRGIDRTNGNIRIRRKMQIKTKLADGWIERIRKKVIHLLSLDNLLLLVQW